MHKKTHCYQVILKGPESQLLKRKNTNLLPLSASRHLFHSYRDAKAYLRTYVQRHLEEWEATKSRVMAQTSFDLDFKPTTDIADDVKKSTPHYDGWDKEQY